jgi:hypothetical protein
MLPPAEERRSANSNIDCYGTQAGATGALFATLPPERTLVLWLDPPDRDRIEAALSALPQERWAAYVGLVRRSLDASRLLVVRGAEGRLNLHDLDTMLARATWSAIEADPHLARSYLHGLVNQPRAHG